MKRFLTMVIVVVMLLMVGCSKQSPIDSSGADNSSDGVRIGAVCKDGTTTDATGSGACSHHGGVDHWLYR